MSFYGFDAAGYVGDIASVAGWSDFAEWAMLEKDAPEVLEFVTNGCTDNPAKFAEELGALKSDDAGVESIRENLIALARKADSTLILSDDVS